ncbi:cytokine receptor-like factor 2 [Oncorhynchus keta]|uniref:cytokine receptor-like factor 2 n=1 Tax=Oncorhynchus keta TaxID=8018 RepID=UPI0015FD63C2|nr:cytokine receptor-like factor 2 [Oncorhynchus keta]
MCTSALFAWLLSMLVLCSEARKDHPKKTKERRIPLDHQKSIREAINPNNICLDLSDSSDAVFVSWRNPNRVVGDHCYESTLQYRNHCDTDWQVVVLKEFSYQVDKPDRKRRYYFRIRMRYDCLFGDLKTWSGWTPTRYWRNETETGPCATEINAIVYVVTILPLLICFLLIVTFSQKRVRRLFLPHIPDPKHTCETLFSMDQFQWHSTFTEPSVECETVDIEIVSTAKTEEEEEAEREDGQAEEESTHIDPVSHLTDLGLQSYPDLEVNGTYVFW